MVDLRGKFFRSPLNVLWLGSLVVVGCMERRRKHSSGFTYSDLKKAAKASSVFF